MVNAQSAWHTVLVLALLDPVPLGEKERDSLSICPDNQSHVPTHLPYGHGFLKTPCGLCPLEPTISNLHTCVG